MKNAVELKSLKVSLSAAVGFFLVVTTFQNCSKASFETTGSSQAQQVTRLCVDGSVSASQNCLDPKPPTVSCTNELQQINTPVKFYLVVDMSGSNEGNPYFRSGVYALGADPKTDHQKIMRYNSMKQFVEMFKSKANFSWGLTLFQGLGNDLHPEVGLDRDLTVLAASSSASDMASAIEFFNQRYDYGRTPYQEAIDEIQNQIESDQPTRTPDTKYVVVFISDGRPTLPGSASSAVDDLRDFSQSVKNLTAVVPNQISFNTVYYGPIDADASNRLKGMAEAGGGQFLDTNENPTGKAFLLSDWINVPSINCTLQ